MRVRRSRNAVTAAVAMTAVVMAGTTPATADPTADPEPGVPYLVVALHSDKCLSVQGGSSADGAGIVQRACGPLLPTSDQHWVLHEVRFGEYELRAKHSGKCVDVQGADLEDDATVVQYRCGYGADNRTFRLLANDLGSYQIQAVHSGKCLDVKGSSQADNAPVVQYHCNAAAPNRNWLFRTL